MGDRGLLVLLAGEITTLLLLRQLILNAVEVGPECF
jgi:hypothetical protein